MFLSETYIATIFFISCNKRLRQTDYRLVQGEFAWY